MHKGRFVFQGPSSFHKGRIVWGPSSLHKGQLINFIKYEYITNRQNCFDQLRKITLSSQVAICLGGRILFTGQGAICLEDRVLFTRCELSNIPILLYELNYLLRSIESCLTATGPKPVFTLIVRPPFDVSRSAFC